RRPPSGLAGLEELLDRAIRGRLVGELVRPDYALVVEQVHLRETFDQPSRADRAFDTRFPPAPPSDLALGDRSPQGLPVGIGVHTEQRERPALEPLDEGPLLRIHRTARATPVARKRQKYDPAAVVAQLERVAVDVSALDLRSPLADRQVAKTSQIGPRDVCQ